MAFNGIDAQQRAYTALDTCNPGGAWVGEMQYNKTRSQVTGKVLVGNWQEEERLAESMASPEADGIKESTVWGKDILNGKLGKKPLQSSAFLTKDPAQTLSSGEHFSSCNRSIYGNHAAAMSAAPTGGPRRRLREAQILAEASSYAPNSTLGKSSPQNPALSLSGGRSVSAPHSSHVQKVHVIGSNVGPGEFDTTNRAREREATEGLEPELPLHGLKDGQAGDYDYHRDMPITRYTEGEGNKGRFLGTSAATGKSAFAKNANFSTPVTVANKVSTPQF